MKKTVTMLIIMSIGLWADFSKIGNIVTDSTTGLQWQDDAIGSQMTWQSAIDHCEGLSLDGFDDWRLPNVNELKTIVDRSKGNPAIVSGFENVGSSNYSSYYWSSTTSKDYSYYTYNAWIVNFSYGYVDNYDKYDNVFVRCVRGGD